MAALCWHYAVLYGFAVLRRRGVGIPGFGDFIIGGLGGKSWARLKSMGLVAEGD